MVVESTDAIEFKVLPFFRNFFSRGDKGVKIFDIEKSKKKNFALDFLRKNVVLIFLNFRYEILQTIETKFAEIQSRNLTAVLFALK